MKLGNKRFWIAFFAALFLSSKVAAAVQLCVHDMSRVGQVAAAEADGWGNPDKSHAPALGTDECCDTQVQARSVDTADCCAQVTPTRRSGGQHCCAGSPDLGTMPALSSPLPYGSWKPTSPAAVPLFHVARPPFAILFKNFRS